MVCCTTTINRCDALVHEALLHERPADVVQAIDDISDVVCGVSMPCTYVVVGGELHVYVLVYA